MAHGERSEHNPRRKVDREALASPEVQLHGLEQASGMKAPEHLRSHILGQISETPQEQYKGDMAMDWMTHLRHLQSSAGGGHDFDTALKIANNAADSRERRN